ncbi:MAG TPA: ABC transporter ATP-binding protein [Caldilineaceae bacterium]|nr:ABC transporter ATP-binding protein [Caldilineaceae bacterium]
MASADQQANTANATPQPPLDPSAMTIDKEQVQRDLAKIEAAPLVAPEEDPDAAATIPGGATQAISQDWALFRLLGGALRPYRGWMTLSLLIMLVVAGLNVVPPYLLQQAIDGPIAQGNSAALWRIALIYGVTAVAIFGLTYAYTYFLQQAGQRALADLRVRLFKHLLNHDYAFLSQTSTGELVARLTNDIDQLNAVLSSSVVVVLVEGATFIGVITMMLIINWRLALLAMIILPIVTVVTVYFRKRIRRSSQSERTAMARISAFLNEHLHGMTVVQLFNREEESAEEFDAFNSRYRRALIILRHNSAVFLSMQEVLAAIGLGLMLYAGGLGVLAGWATLGILVAFIQYTQRAFRPIITLSRQYNAVQVALGAAERIYRMLETPPTIQSPANPTPLGTLDGTIQFENVHFRYVEDEPVLRGISLTIPAGQSVAIVGATGAGKSSLVSLLARQYDPQQGAICLDDTDIRQLALGDLRRAVAVVPQDPVCLAGTIRRNIRLYDDDVSDAQVRQAAEFTNAAAFIEELPNGYDFTVLPGGTNLSQGQRQLLALARALALSPDGVLVLDEATSSIDTATEALIQEALERILRTRTSLVIAHRLSTIRNADRIIVMDQGKIVEDGNHESLLAAEGFYARLHEHQTVPQLEPVGMGIVGV